MDFTSPWDDLDLDLVPPSRPIPRLKLSAPTFYFSLLPIRNPEQWEDKWNKANTAADMCAITTECIEHERKIVGYFEELEWTESTSVAASTNPVDDPESEEAVSMAPASEAPEETPEETPEASSSTESGVPPSVAAAATGFYIPMAKRICFKETLESGSGFNSPNPPVSIVALHDPVFKAVTEWHNLVTEASGIEDHLLAIQSRLNITPTSTMSQDELEAELKQIQTAAGKVVLELDEAAYAVHEKLGVNSEAVAQYKKEDPAVLIREYYDEGFEWQVRVFGVFAWWTKAIGGKMGAIV